MTIEVKNLGTQDYHETYEAMRRFTTQRQDKTVDQLWLLEHHPVYTLGLSDSRQHLLDTGTIPVVKTNRGGQVTYHGPGQLIVYLLINLMKRPYRIKKMVWSIEQAVIDYLNSLNIVAERKAKDRGVYVHGEKIAALGIRVERHRTYHGLALNVNMDLQPFKGINPCGHPHMSCTQLAHFVDNISIGAVKESLSDYLISELDQE